MTTGKTMALTRQTFADKVMSMLFNMLFRLVITFLPRTKRLLNFMAAVTICSDFGAQKNSQPLFPHGRSRNKVLRQIQVWLLLKKEVAPRE